MLISLGSISIIICSVLCLSVMPDQGTTPSIGVLEIHSYIRFTIVAIDNWDRNQQLRLFV